MTTDQKGTLTEYQCITYILSKGYNVSVPAVACKYDMILDYNGKLLKLQVKTSVEKEGYIKFHGYSSTGSKGKYKQTRYDKDDIDYFITYYKGECYLIPVDQVSFEKKLWYSLPQNGYTKGVHLLKEYLFEEVISKS